MRIRCVALAPSEDQARQLGAAFDLDRTDYDLDLFREYIALGVGFWDGVSWAEIATDGGWILSVPLFLFEITDARASKHWEVRADATSLTLWPSRLYDPTFNARLADDVPEAVEAFHELRELLETEALTN
jgi:hypothetical protein